MANYRIYFKKQNSNQMFEFKVVLPGIKSLAKFLNNHLKRHREKQIVLVHLVDSKNVFITNVKFLREEYVNQKFLTGHKERLLAKALSDGYELNWKPDWR
jgi:hypothetical protein